MTKNLREALALIRHLEPITMWVDLICINQRDLNERRDQVLQMRRIYALAQQTRILLGDLAECYRMLENWKAKGRERAVEQMFSEMWTRLPASGEVWNFTSVMLSSAWFTGVWTIQELAVASKASIIDGRNAMEWSQLDEALGMVQLAKEYIELHRQESWFKQKNGILAFCIPETGAILSEDQVRDIHFHYTAMPTSLVALRKQVQENNPASLVLTLRHAWYHKATDPKDKVYALLGVIAENERQRYKVIILFRLSRPTHSQ